MADSSVAITAGSGTAIDTQIPTGGDHRQVVVLGDPTTIAGVLPVDATFGIPVRTTALAATATTGSITTSSTAVTATVSNYGNATITVRGTYAGVSYKFQASDDGTNFFPIQVQRETDGAVITSDTPATNGSVIYLLDLPGYVSIQVLATAFTSGSASVRISPGGTLAVPVVSIGNITAGTGTPTSVTATVTANTTLLAANNARTGFSLYNNSTATLTILCGAGTQSATVFTTKVAPNGYYEDSYRFTGRVSGQWTAANGAVAITEYSA